MFKNVVNSTTILYYFRTNTDVRNNYYNDWNTNNNYTHYNTNNNYNDWNTNNNYNDWDTNNNYCKTAPITPSTT